MRRTPTQNGHKKLAPAIRRPFPVPLTAAYKPPPLISPPPPRLYAHLPVNKQKKHPIVSFTGYNPLSKFIEMTSIYEDVSHRTGTQNWPMTLYGRFPVALSVVVSDFLQNKHLSNADTYCRVSMVSALERVCRI